MATEADTCRKFVVPKPKLQARHAGWDFDPHSIAEQRSLHRWPDYFARPAAAGAGQPCGELSHAQAPGCSWLVSRK